jgi:hypothetical protein
MRTALGAGGCDEAPDDDPPQGRRGPPVQRNMATKSRVVRPAPESLEVRLARIEATRAEFMARCDKLVADSLERDYRVTALLGL